MSFTVSGFLLLFCRLSGLFISAPVLSSRMMPVRVKIFTIAALAAVLCYIVPLSEASQKISTPAMFIAALVLEIVVGYTIGFVAYVALGAIQLAGQLMDMQMGFAIVNVVDPQSGTQIPLMGNLTQTIALLIYLSMNGHHYLLQALVQSYKAVPVLGFSMSSDLMKLLTGITVYMFIIALKIAAPLVIAVLTTDVAMGFIARTVPQMNVFLVGMPIKIMLGLGALLVMLPVYIWVFGELFVRFFAYIDQLVLVMGL
ncbi:flagellar biosynthetic protein FliR [Syntrophomonas palmitatica]|uniref:flagellar biosynthetic protein FliR n=1 Tax=Syntrophomonas palmitatica TaxID=402877 RepID=UPI0006D23034|nr:flagellar biosynthetic protein FliR [Syntrophomonas palmitatica]